MSLVLAVQPDIDQAARLTSVCRRIGAELVLAPSAPEALAALEDRIPDVILTAPLLPATDEAAIADRLRTLGDRALHVQTLAAPVLGEPVVEPRPRGLLEALRWQRQAAGPAVCDPLVFAGELSGHLLRAVGERAAINSQPIAAPDFEEILAQAARHGGNALDHQATDGARPKPGMADAPANVDLTPLLDGVARQRPRKQSRRRRRRVYDDTAYFDPARCEFAAVLEKFDDFVERGPGAA